MAFIKDEEKQVLLDRYLDIQWPDDVADLRCVRCQRVAITHYLSNCKHLFCKNCRRVFSDGGQWKCPQCQQYVTQLDDQDIDVEFKMHKLTIFCPNKKYGCKYADQLRKIPSHLMTCEDTREAALPVEYTGTNRIEAVVDQLSKVNASIGELKEGMKDTKDQLERKTDEMDTKFNELINRVDSMEQKPEARNVEMESAFKKYADECVSIRSQLESMDQRIQQNESLHHQVSTKMEAIRNDTISIIQDMEKRLAKERQMGEVSSEFKGLQAAQHALAERMDRMEKAVEERNKDIKLVSKKHTDEYESMESLLKLTNLKSRDSESLLKQKIQQMSLKMDELNQEMKTLQNQKSELFPLKTETYEWTIKDMKKFILKGDWISESNQFGLIGCKYDIRAKLEKSNGSLSIYLQFKDGNTINQLLDKYGYTKVKYIIKDQSNAQGKNIIKEGFLQILECLYSYDWIIERVLPETILSPPYMKDDCIKMTILFEPPSIDRSFVSNNGILKWRVDNYKIRKQEQQYSTLWSPSFYTSPLGYRVKILLFINYSQPSVVSVYFLTGEHDAKLTFDFHHKTTITLINQKYPSKHLVKSEQHEDIRYYPIKLESSELFEKNGCIKDDSLLLEVVIEPVQ